MKQFNYYFFTFFAAAVILALCGKNGAVGPQGPAGATGPQGTVGATGADGTKIYSGTGAPATTLGNTGDFYLNTATSDFYGPKTATGWGTPTNLVGATGAAGANGAAGSQIYSGTTAPAASLGVNGDYYLNTTNYLFYGPKTAGTWPAPINLKGATGPQGPPGTANVIYSDWITPSTYTKDTIFSIYHLYANIPAPAITQAILDNGTVVVYGRLDGYVSSIWPTDQVSALPIILTYEEGTTTYTDTWSALATLGNVKIDFTDDLNLYNGVSNAHQFRYVIIPGAVLTSHLKNINLSNYLQVKQALHLPD